ncbi:MAG: uroporphyrinogen-III C-methyltransferase [Nitrospirota bacterium]
MSAASHPPTARHADTVPTHRGSQGGKALLYAVGTVAVVALAASGLLWQKLSTIQETLARQSQDASAQAIEARTIARQAQEQVTEASARLTVQETRVSEVALQRSQLEELMQSLSRSRDENLVVDIESSLRLAQQQAQLTGSLEPLIAALKSAQQRIERAAQPRLAPVQRAITRDLERIASASVADTAGLLGRLDDLVRQVDDLPLQNAVAQAAATRRMNARGAMPPSSEVPAPADQTWWQALLQRSWEVVRDEARDLVRVSRIDQPEAILVSPDQAFFLRENLKLKLLNARLGLLARQSESARADLAAASAALNKYFDPASRRTQSAATVLQQAQAHMKTAEQPRLDETLSALATAAAGR